MAHNKFTILINVKALVAINPQISLPEITLALGIKRRPIEKAFSDLAHVSFRTWRRALVMGKAADRLLNSEISTEQLACEFGYGSSRAFSRAFKETIGISVVEFRSNR